MKMKKLKAAKGRVVITPPIGTPMAGNVRIDNKTRGVHDDLYCNILIIKDNDKKVCLLGFDLIGLEFETCNDIKLRIEKESGIPSSNIMFWATHTHSGPDTGMRMYGIPDPSVKLYIEEMIVRVVAGVKIANLNFEEVTLKAGKTIVTDLSFNRRLVKKDKSVVMNFEEFSVDDITGTTGPVDEELITFSAWDNNERLFALLVNFTLHPAILVGYKWLVSRDYIHFLDEYILNSFGRQAVMLFANGAEGNVNHLNYLDPDQLRSFDETKRIGEKLGEYVGESLKNSSLLYGNLKFVSEKVALPLRNITEEEKVWADMVLVRDKDVVEDMFDGIPDKTYARMIKEMLVRPDQECETVLQGIAVHDFAAVTFPGEVYVEFGLQVKKLSPYKNTMVIGLANSQVGYIPKAEAFSEGGYEVRTAWTSQLVHNAGDILVSLVRDKVLNNLLSQSVRIMERKASDNKYLHKDFHLALNLMMQYLYDNFGKEALVNYLEDYSRAFYSLINKELKTGDISVLARYFTDIYRKEEWPVRINSGKDFVEIEQDACPAMSHIIQKGSNPCPHYAETYNTVYKTLCENTPFEYTLEYFDERTGACRQAFRRKEVKS